MKYIYDLKHKFNIIDHKRKYYHENKYCFNISPRKYHHQNIDHLIHIMIYIKKDNDRKKLITYIIYIYIYIYIHTLI